MIGVKRVAGDDAPAVYKFFVGYVLYIRMPSHMALSFVMRLKLTKQLRCDLEQVRCEALIPDHQHVTLDKARFSAARVSLSIAWVKSVHPQAAYGTHRLEPDYLRSLGTS
jgi:hypothetical protein